MVASKTVILWLFVVFFALIKPPLAGAFNEKDVRCLALNLYWEGRSEGRKGMVAIGWVVLNRMDDHRYPDEVCAIVRQGGEKPPCEWSWWCDGRSDRPQEKEAWRKAQALARQLLTDPPPDPTDGALWYYNVSIKTPLWLKSREKTASIGEHIFYR